jgi:competence protein ComEC
VSPIATSIALAIGLLALVRVGRRLLPFACAVLYFAGAWRAGRALSAHDRARDATIRAGPWPSRIEVRGPVVRSPTLLGDAVRVDVEDQTRGRVSLSIPRDEASISPGALARGDVIEAIAQLAPLDRFANEGVLDLRVVHARRGVVLSGGAMNILVVRRGRGPPAWVDRMRAHVRARIVATFTPETNGMARALVLGEDDVGDEDRRAFRKSGLAHLLAVSGMHLVLVVASFVAALRAVLVRVPAVVSRWDAWRIACAVGLPLVWLYADFAGGSGSAVRAAWMTSAALVARVLDRKSNAWRAAGLALAAIAFSDALAAFDLSFVLSALATAGLLAISPPIVESLGARWPRAPGYLVRAFAATAAATIACTPVLACMAPELPLGSIVANLVAVPLGEAAALPLCLAHALLAPFPAAEQGAAIAASGALALVRIVARAFAVLVVPVPMPSAAHLTVLAGGAIATFVARRFSRVRVALIATVMLVAVEVLVRIRGAPSGGVRVTFLDVAQGDSALVDLPDGSAMLIDGGGIVGSPVDVGERVLAPFLRARRRGRIDVVVLSHPHPDHFLGLASALDAVEVGELWDTGQGETEGAGPIYDAFLARMRARGVRVLRPPDLCGTRAVGGAKVDVLAPCPAVVGDRGANDNSFVLRVTYGSRSFLFAGDAEHVEEDDLVAHPASADRLRADVLKVGHHGSRTSTTATFVSAVRPSLAVISCGVRNRFGHPSATTLDTLTAEGVQFLRTDRRGSVVVRTNGADLTVE